MDASDGVLPPAGLLTSGNTQPILQNQPLRDATTGLPSTGAVRNPRGDPQPSNQSMGATDPTNPLARYDKLEFRMEETDRRVDDLEIPIIPDPDPPYFSEDTEGIPYRSHREVMASDGDVPRFFNHSRRARGGDVRR